MRTSEAGQGFIKGFEQCRLVAYPDPASGGWPWTLGWGRAHGISQHQTCTQLEADEWFREDLREAESIVEENVHVELTQGQFDALVSIVENVGPGVEGHRDGIIRLASGKPSTLLRKLNAGDYAGAAAEFERWDRGPNGEMAGLLRRRKGERAMFEGRA